MLPTAAPHGRLVGPSSVCAAICVLLQVVGMVYGVYPLDVRRRRGREAVARAGQGQGLLRRLQRRSLQQRRPRLMMRPLDTLTALAWQEGQG